MKRGRWTIVLFAASLVLASSMLTRAGNPTPPAGPVVGTMKTLDQVEPRVPVSATTTPGDANSVFRIAQPGSYYLTGNLTGVAAKHGIKIDSNDVTLDLSGYTVRGIPASLGGVTIDVTVNDHNNIAIRNGVVREWGQHGVGIASTKGGGTAVGGVVESIQAWSNGMAGIAAPPNSRVRACTASANAGGGIFVFSGVVEDCAAYSNTGYGISASNGAAVRSCTTGQNTLAGISVANGCAAVGCTATGNPSVGILATSVCAIEGCTATSNGGDGISASFSCRITGCQASFNGADGIELQNECQVIGNTCHRNGEPGDGAGIHASGFYNRIEGNTVSLNDRGIDVDMFDNIVIRNTARANGTNYTIVASNIVGVVIAVPHSAAVNGNSGGAGVGTTDPAANYAY